MSKIVFNHTYQDIISLENLLMAWKEFLKGKHRRKDVQEFQQNLMANMIELHNDLKNETYRHGGYEPFNKSDPKPRKIHKASVRDRLLHHAIYRFLYPFFERTFIADSYSCQLNKAGYKAINKFRNYFRKVSRNHTRTCWILKCDIRKFFEHIDHDILLNILDKYIQDPDVVRLLENIIRSFSARPGGGLPLGNLTSQLFVNIYMNEFDQFMKHYLKAKHYIRYADDFVVLSGDKDWLLELMSKIADFLKEELRLELHPDKVFIKTVYSGVDFLGWVHFPDHRVLRTVTKRRMLKKIIKDGRLEILASYRGLISHGNGKKLESCITELAKSELF